MNKKARQFLFTLHPSDFCLSAEGDGSGRALRPVREEGLTMLTERPELTDDLGLSPEFLADEDIARDLDSYGRPSRCTCGFRAAYEAFLADGPERNGYGDHFPHEGFTGCRGCDPVEPECKPYGWLIERFEDPALLAANED